MTTQGKPKCRRCWTDGWITLKEGLCQPCVTAILKAWPEARASDYHETVGL